MTYISKIGILATRLRVYELHFQISVDSAVSHIRLLHRAVYYFVVTLKAEFCIEIIYISFPIKTKQNARISQLQFVCILTLLIKT